MAAAVETGAAAAEIGAAAAASAIAALMSSSPAAGDRRLVLCSQNLVHPLGRKRRGRGTSGATAPPHPAGPPDSVGEHTPESNA